MDAPHPLVNLDSHESCGLMCVSPPQPLPIASALRQRQDSVSTIAISQAKSLLWQIQLPFQQFSVHIAMMGLSSLLHHGLLSH